MSRAQAFTLRPAANPDLRVLSRIAIEAKASWGYDQEELQGWADELTVTPESLEAQLTFLAEADGEIAGFFQLSGDAAQLEHLWIRPKFMAIGLGRRLLALAAAEAARSGQTKLAIDSDPNARGFYTACGAVQVGELPAPTARMPDRTRPLMELDTSIFK
ncbi:MAG: GNAT family N-acetyltransferase [Xanthomonadales bacterium]|nr:GNAT family N-acetyltransferase [Xanthomonadales bacterium]